MGTPVDQVKSGARRKPAGSSKEPRSVKRCRRSFGLGPNSRSRSFGSIGPLEKGIWSSFA